MLAKDPAVVIDIIMIREVLLETAQTKDTTPDRLSNRTVGQRRAHRVAWQAKKTAQNRGGRATTCTEGRMIQWHTSCGWRKDWLVLLPHMPLERGVGDLIYKRRRCDFLRFYMLTFMATAFQGAKGLYVTYTKHFQF